MKQRCDWCNNQTIYQNYHDNEWGIPQHDDRKLFEILSLEGAQAGLSWITILKKREAYKNAFDDFDVQKIVNYSDEKVKELMNNPGIVRNKLKINSVIKNAKVFVKIQEEFGSFDTYFWGFVNHIPIKNNFQSLSEIPVSTDLSTKISTDLKKRGMSFVGPVVVYAYMQAIGIVNDHIKNCHLYQI